MEQTSRGGAYGLGVVEIDGVAADQNGIGSERVGAPDHRAEIAWIAYLITQHDQPRPRVQRLVSWDVDHLADRNQALWRYCLGQLSDRPSWRDSDADPKTVRDFEQLAVPVQAVIDHHQLNDGIRPSQCLGDDLRTLGEKSPSYLSFLTAQQPTNGPQHRLRSCRQISRPVETVLGQRDLRRPWRRWPARFLWPPRQGRRMLQDLSRQDQRGS